LIRICRGRQEEKGDDAKGKKRKDRRGQAGKKRREENVLT
jgi:hypothetical protein